MKNFQLNAKHGIYNIHTIHMITMTKQAISITLDKLLIQQIDHLATDTDRPRSWFIERAISSYLEDLTDAEIALQRLHDDQDTILSSEDIKKKLNV